MYGLPCVPLASQKRKGKIDSELFDDFYTMFVVLRSSFVYILYSICSNTRLLIYILVYPRVGVEMSEKCWFQIQKIP